MNSTIRFYKQDGTLSSEETFDSDNIEHTRGMLIKCVLKDGSEVVGYSKPSDYITMLDDLELWLYKDINTLEQESIFVKMKDVVRIDAILYSNPRWSGKITNEFFVNIKE